MNKYLDNILRKPHYDFERDGELYFPSKEEYKKEIKSRLNVMSNKKNWISLFSILTTLILLIPLALFGLFYFDFKILLLSICYTMIIKNIHCTAYLHRYVSHKAFQVKNSIWLFLFRHATVKVISEEIYGVSHLVHHAKSEQAGDPYNALGGWAYCFFAEITHNPIALDLSQENYNRTAGLLKHTEIRLNSYEEYKKWGSISHPLYTCLTYLGNWTFWFVVFYLLTQNIAYPLAFFGMSGIWAISIRNFNFKGHGSGENKHKEGRDFYKKDLSVNIPLAGYAAGEWHNNHHAYPTSARNDFLPGQPDFTFYFIYLFYKLGIVTKFIDKKTQFQTKYINHNTLKTRGIYEVHNSKLS